MKSGTMFAMEQDKNKENKGNDNNKIKYST